MDVNGHRIDLNDFIFSVCDDVGSIPGVRVCVALGWAIASLWRQRRFVRRVGCRCLLEGRLLLVRTDSIDIEDLYRAH